MKVFLVNWSDAGDDGILGVTTTRKIAEKLISDHRFEVADTGHDLHLLKHNIDELELFDK